MKHINRSVIGLLFSVFILLSLSINVNSSTTIGTSTLPVKEGEIDTWKCTYCSSNWSTFLGVDSKLDVIINRVYKGSYTGINQALIVDASLNYSYKALDSQLTIRVPFYVVYNETLRYIRCLNSLIIPIPINLSLIAEYIILRGDNCSITGNKLDVDYGYNRSGQYTYNSNGFATKFEYKEIGITQYIIKLVSGETMIEFGNYYIIITLITLICGIIIIKKRNRFLK